MTLALALIAVLHLAPAQAAAVVDALTGAGATPAEAADLAAIGWRESSYRAEVIRCEVRGARGELGAWQERDRGGAGGLLCAGGLPVQARRALGHWRACSGDLGERMACYMGRSSRDAEVRRRVELARRLGGG